MMIRCTNCHQLFDSLSGVHKDSMQREFCSYACQQEYSKKQRMAYLAIGTTNALIRQKKEQREAQITAIQAQAAQRKAQENAQLQEKDDDIDKLLKWQEEAEERGRLALKTREAEESSTVGNFIKNLKTEEQNKKDFKISHIHAKFNEWLFYIFAILEQIILVIFGELLFSRYGFWKTFFSSISLGIIIWYPISLIYTNFKIHRVSKKVLKIKDADDFPFFKIYTNFWLIAELLVISKYLVFFGLSILISTMMFSFHAPIILRILSVISIFVVFVWAMWAMDKSTSSENNKKQLKKENLKFKNYKSYIEYKLSKKLKSKIGNYVDIYWWGEAAYVLLSLSIWITASSSKEFLEAETIETLKEEYWRLTFLPYKEDSKFTEKYGNYTKTGIYSIEQLYDCANSKKESEDSEEKKELLAEMERRKSLKNLKPEKYGPTDSYYRIFNYSYEKILSVLQSSPEIKDKLIECDFGSDETHHGTIYEVEKKDIIKRFKFFPEEYEIKMNKIEASFRKKAKNHKIKKDRDIQDIRVLESNLKHNLNRVWNK